LIFFCVMYRINVKNIAMLLIIAILEILLTAKTLKLRKYQSHGIKNYFHAKFNSRLPCYSREFFNYDEFSSFTYLRLIKLPRVNRHYIIYIVTTFSDYLFDKWPLNGDKWSMVNTLYNATILKLDCFSRF